MERDIAKEASKFFKEMGLEDEMAKLTEVFVDNFMIRGEETEDLKEALHRAPDSLLDMIWGKIAGKEPEEGISRQQKEDSLYEDIPGYFASRFELLDIRKIKLLVRIMNNYPANDLETAEVMEEFVPYGWVFSFAENQSSVFVVMNEVRDIIMTLDKPEVKERISFMSGIRFIINTCLGLNGVSTIEQIHNIFCSTGTDEDGREKMASHLDEVIQEFLPYLEEQKVLWTDGKYIVSPYFNTKEEYKRLLRVQKRDYYVPDDDMIRSYGLGKMVVKNEEYETVFKLLSREIKDQEQAEEMLEAISGYVVRKDWEVPQIMNCLYDWDVVFTSERETQKLIKALDEWLHVIRRWSECGHCRKEIYGKKTNFYFGLPANKNGAVKETLQKIYPNDPCPCGSGEKYKKCCGRK